MTVIDPETLSVASFEYAQCVGRGLRPYFLLPLIELVAPAVPDEVAEFAPEVIEIDVEQANFAEP